MSPPPRIEHNRQGRVSHVHQSEEVHLDLLADVTPSCVSNRIRQNDAGVVHENVDAPERILRSFDQFRDISFVGNVGRDGEYLLVADLSGDRFEPPT